MPSSHTAYLLLQTDVWQMVARGTVFTDIILGVLLVFSIYSWTIIFAKMGTFGAARKSDAAFLRAFRKSKGLDSVVAASEQFRPSPLVGVFDYGYEEVNRQVKARGGIRNRDAVQRSLQIGTSEELARLEKKLGWLATTASVSPFIGLLGTVIGIIRAFQNLGSAGSTSLAAVGPGISEALIATAVGLFAAIPAAMAYNQFGQQLKEMGNRMDNFSLEFLNLIERTFGE